MSYIFAVVFLVFAGVCLVGGVCQLGMTVNHPEHLDDALSALVLATILAGLSMLFGVLDETLERFYR